MNFDSQLMSALSRIEPTPLQKTAASNSHNFLRAILRSGLPQGLWLDDYLMGSYSRDTAIRPIDDVDIVVLIEPARLPGSRLAPASVLPDPVRALDTIADVIRLRYPISRVSGQRRSICLELNHLSIDVVPAIPTVADRLVIWVPDRELQGWIKSSPQRHSDVATRINQNRGGKVKPLVKLIKSWNATLPATSQLRSFAIETAVMTLFNRIGMQSIFEGALSFLDYMCSLKAAGRAYAWSDRFGIQLGFLGLSVPDLAGTGSNVAEGTTYQQAAAFLSSAEASRDLLMRARATPGVGGWELVRRALSV